MKQGLASNYLTKSDAGIEKIEISTCSIFSKYTELGNTHDDIAMSVASVELYDISYRFFLFAKLDIDTVFAFLICRKSDSSTFLYTFLKTDSAGHL